MHTATRDGIPLAAPGEENERVVFLNQVKLTRALAIYQVSGPVVCRGYILVTKALTQLPMGHPNGQDLSQLYDSSKNHIQQCLLGVDAGGILEEKIHKLSVPRDSM